MEASIGYSLERRADVSRWMVPVLASQSMVVKSKYLFGIRASGMIEIEEDEEEARRRGGEGTPLERISN